LLPPPFQNPDENKHFFRAYQISQGIFVSQKVDEGKRGVMVSQDLIDLSNSFEPWLSYHPAQKTSIKEIAGAFSLPQTSQSSGFYPLYNEKFYSPFSYIPQAFLILLGRQLPIPVLGLLYLGRLASLGCWIVLIWISLRLLPYKKWLFFYLALTPMAMAIGSALSVDTVTNGLGFLWIALCLHYALDDSVKYLSMRQKLLLVFVAACLGLAKQSVIPLVLCLFAIPKTKWRTWKSYMGWASVVLFVSLSTYFVWYLIVCDFTVPYFPKQALPKEQLCYIFNHPKAYFLTFFSTHLSLDFISNMITQYIGQKLGWLDVELPVTFVVVYAIFLVMLCLNNTEDEPALSLTQRFIFLTTWTLTIFVIATLLYLVWTPVGGHSIEGPQGRYYIMSGPAFFIAISGLLKTPFNVKQSAATVIAFLFGALTITVTVGSLIVRYY
jgi:uncharacterized membrane protein